MAEGKMAAEVMGNVAQGVADKRDCADVQGDLIRAQKFISNCDTQPGIDESGRIKCRAETSEWRNRLRIECAAKCGSLCKLSGGKRKSKRANKKRRSSRRKSSKSRRRR